MRSIIFEIFITSFLACAGTVQAGDLDGESLFCKADDTTHPVYGLLFDQGKVTRWQVDGFSKMKAVPIRPEEPDLLGGGRVVIQ